MPDSNNDYDDALQNNTDDVNPSDEMKDSEQLPGDNDTPFSDPQTQEGQLSETHPKTDSNVDSDQRYQEGVNSATGANPPSSEDRIPGYDPENDQRKEE